VELKKPASTVKKRETGEQEKEPGAAPAQSAPSVDLKHVPDNPTPAQALNILQQMKKQAQTK